MVVSTLLRVKHGLRPSPARVTLRHDPVPRDLARTCTENNKTTGSLQGRVHLGRVASKTCSHEKPNSSHRGPECAGKDMIRERTTPRTCKRFSLSTVHGGLPPVNRTGSVATQPPTKQKNTTAAGGLEESVKKHVTYTACSADGFGWRPGGDRDTPREVHLRSGAGGTFKPTIRAPGRKST